MSNQYNFYQYGGTGDNSCFIFSGGQCIWSGPVLPVSDLHFTDYTGFYITPSILAGQHVGFLWSLTNESNLFAPTLKIRYTGEVGNTLNDRPTFSVGISGDISPLLTDSENFFINLSGQQSGQANERNIFSIVYSGQVSGKPLDYVPFGINYTGDVSSDNIDLPVFTASFTGQQVSQMEDHPCFSIFMSGEIEATKKDNMGINCIFATVSYAIGGRFLTINIPSNTGIIDFRFVSVSFERPQV